MADFRDDDYDGLDDRGGLDEEDVLYEQDRQARISENDEFATFDPRRFMRRKKTELTGSQDATAASQTSTRANRDLLNATPDELAARFRRRSRVVRTNMQQYDGQIESDDRQGVLGVLTGGLDPGLRIIFIGIGCFGLMLLIGGCGIVLYLAGVLANR